MALAISAHHLVPVGPQSPSPGAYRNYLPRRNHTSDIWHIDEIHTCIERDSHFTINVQVVYRVQSLTGLGLRTGLVSRPRPARTWVAGGVGEFSFRFLPPLPVLLGVRDPPFLDDPFANPVEAGLLADDLLASPVEGDAFAMDPLERDPLVRGAP